MQCRNKDRADILCRVWGWLWVAVQNLVVLSELLLKSVTNRAIEKKITEFAQRVLELNTAGEPSAQQRETLTQQMEQHIADKV